MFREISFKHFLVSKSVIGMSIWAGVSAVTFGLGGFFYWKSSNAAQRAQVIFLSLNLFIHLLLFTIQIKSESGRLRLVCESVFVNS